MSLHSHTFHVPPLNAAYWNVSSHEKEHQEIRAIKKNQYFLRNRYNSKSLLESYRQKSFEELNGEVYKSLVIGETQLDLYFLRQTLPVDPYFNKLAENIVERLADLDNMVQESCERDARDSNLAKENFMLCLAYISIDIEFITLRYWGEKVNTEWDAIFEIKDDNTFEPNNF